MKRAQLARLFARIPPLAESTLDAFTITALPGYTNLNFRLQGAGHDWVLRVPRPRTNRHLDRDAEAFNQAQAAALGLAPEPAWRDPSGLSLTPCLSATRAVTRADLVDAGRAATILQPLARLHRSGLKFAGRVDLGQLLERYYALLDNAQQVALQHRMRAARQLLPMVEDRDCAPVPSHNDLVLENLLLEGGRVWLIDWEFSAQASPYWDLATLCNAANLDYQQSLALLRIYCADAAPMEESLLFDYRNLLQLLGDCWLAAMAD